ncbi:alpha/beta hydrolase [Allohahella marinimesophila]|uniref:AB hydrolase-1 domain-containing protein n=1 Tax=Allohahella marinimesophila TaxID=1054972 RepID=A0ABP7NPM6_9GAMM
MQKPLIVLLPGLFMPISSWSRETLRHLRQFGDCVPLSLPGHYPEPALQEGQHYDKALVLESIDRQLAEQLEPEQLASRPVVLFGHSTGALTALYYASQRQDLVSAVISIGGTVDGREEENVYYWNQLGTRYLGTLGLKLTNFSTWLGTMNAATHRLVMKAAFHNPHKVLADGDFEAAMPDYFPDLRKFDTSTAGRILRDLYQFDAKPELTRLHLPVWVCAGEEDDFVPERRTRELTDTLPEATLDVIPDTGHLPFVEETERFFRSMRVFMQQVGLGVWAENQPALSVREAIGPVSSRDKAALRSATRKLSASGS